MNQYLDELRNNEYVREKALCGNVHSFNYSNKAFFEGRWDSVTTRARGLFCDMDTETVVARSFDKFFAVGERSETQFEVLKDTLKFPVAAYCKENGFLGICSYRAGEDNDLFVASKSTNEGDFAILFRSILNHIMPAEKQYVFAQTLRSMNCSAVFEVIDPFNDPHIVKYDKANIILLALIRNDFEYQSYSFWMVQEVAKIYNLDCKQLVKVIDNWEEFVEFYKSALDEKYIEGYVFEDNSGYMLKLKTNWYKYWKRMRSVLQALIKSNKTYSAICQRYRITKDDEPLFTFMIQYAEEAKMNGLDSVANIIDVREQFLPKVEL